LALTCQKALSEGELDFSTATRNSDAFQETKPAFGARSPASRIAEARSADLIIVATLEFVSLRGGSLAVSGDVLGFRIFKAVCLERICSSAARHHRIVWLREFQKPLTQKDGLIAHFPLSRAAAGTVSIASAR
jgi:hypothetical protein